MCVCVCGGGVSMAKVKHDHGSVVTEWMDDRYVLGLTPAPRFLRVKFRYCADYESRSAVTINPRAQELCKSRGGKSRLGSRP